jgi:putative addiction module killer protein
MEVRHYVDPSGCDRYRVWLDALRDVRGKVAIARRIFRLRNANFGDCRFCRDGVWELRIDIGPGYRVYFARDGARIVLLLGGGDKGSQQRDIECAVHAWRDYNGRIRNGTLAVSRS